MVSMMVLAAKHLFVASLQKDCGHAQSETPFHPGGGVSQQGSPVRHSATIRVESPHFIPLIDSKNKLKHLEKIASVRFSIIKGFFWIKKKHLFISTTI
jgi:hypothetical protein